MSLIPFATSPISLLTDPVPSTSLFYPLGPSIALVSGLVGIVKKASIFGVTEQELPVSLTIGNSSG